MAADMHDLMERVSQQQEPEWTTEDEIRFRMWYDQKSRQLGLDPDPDSPQHFYDYRAAFKAGADAQVIPEDGLPHWPSTFKKVGHPNLIVDGRDTRTGEPADPMLAAQGEVARKFIMEGGIRPPAADATAVIPRR